MRENRDPQSQLCRVCKPPTAEAVDSSKPHFKVKRLTLENFNNVPLLQASKRSLYGTRPTWQGNLYQFIATYIKIFDRTCSRPTPCLAKVPHLA
jgi:hypothetical protein